MSQPAPEVQQPSKELLEDFLLGQWRAVVRKASPSLEELSALALACLKVGVDPGPLYLQAQKEVPRPESFAPLPPLEEVLPRGPGALQENVDQEHLSAADRQQAEQEARAQAREQAQRQESKQR